MAQTAETAAARTAYAEALPAERLPRIAAFSARLNAYEYPDRRAITAHGHVVTYRDFNGGRALAVWRTDLGGSADLTRALFLVDDARTVTPFYVAGHSPDEDPDLMFLHPVAVHERHTGAGVWWLAPSRAYHLILSRVPAFDTWTMQRYTDVDVSTYWQDPA